MKYIDLVEITKGVAKGLYPILLAKPGTIKNALDDIMGYATEELNSYEIRMKLMPILLDTALNCRDAEGTA